MSRYHRLMKRSRNWLKSHRKGTVFVLSAIVLLVLGTYFELRRREEVHRIRTLEAFGGVCDTLADYSELTGALPAPVERDSPGRVHSWRVSIAPYLGCRLVDPTPNLYKPRNDEPISTVSFGGYPFSYGDSAAMVPMANLLGITGPGTAFGDGREHPSTSMVHAGPTSDAIIAVEVRDSGVKWMEPRDFDIRTMPRTVNSPDGRGISSRYRRGFHVCFLDGDVWFLSHDVPFTELERFFMLDGAAQNDRESILAVYRLDSRKLR